MRANTTQALAAALRGRRVALGWSQADIAAAAGVSRKFVSEVEAGKETVELGKVLSLADAIGLDITISLAVGEDPDVLRLESPSSPARRSVPPPPTGDLDDLLDDYLRADNL
jgi:HTH-type transcriptional regulator / antitoxin HipB